MGARVDAFCASAISTNDATETEQSDIASTLWSKMQKRIDFVEGHKVQIKSKTLAGNVFKKHEFGNDQEQYDESMDFKMKQEKKEKKETKKRKKMEDEENEEEMEEDDKAKKKKKKKDKKDKKKKKKKKKEEGNEEEVTME